jgi:hypothetical protein
MQPAGMTSTRRFELCTEIALAGVHDFPIKPLWEKMAVCPSFQQIPGTTPLSVMTFILKRASRNTNIQDRAAGQFFIEIALQFIATELVGKHGFFKKQKSIRREIESHVIDEKTAIPCSVSRNLLRTLLETEAAVATKIKEKITLFNTVFDGAKKLGFEVFERSEGRLHLYYALEVSYAEIVRKLEQEELRTKGGPEDRVD